MSIEQHLLLNLVDHLVLLEENLSNDDFNAIRSFKSNASIPHSSLTSLLQILPVSIQRQANEYLNEILGQLVLCTGVNVKSQLPSTISHLIKRLLTNRKEIQLKSSYFQKQIQALNELYNKVNRQIQEIFIEQLKMIKAKDLNHQQIETVRDQYQLLLKQMQLRRCQFIRDIYSMDTIDALQRTKLDCEEKQHFYDEQIVRMKSMEKQIISEGSHYQQLLKRYYEICDQLNQAENALKRLKQQHETRLI